MLKPTILESTKEIVCNVLLIFLKVKDFDKSMDSLMWLRLSVCHSHTHTPQSSLLAKPADLSVVDVNGKAAPRNTKDGGIVKKVGEALCVQGCTGNQHLQLRTEASNVLD